MHDNWTDAERLAAEVLASRSDEALRELLAELDRGLPALELSQRSSRSPSSRRSPARRAGAGRKRVRDRPNWRESGLLDSTVDAVVALVAVTCIAIGARSLATPIADARPAISEVLEGAGISAALGDGPSGWNGAPGPVERPVSASEPISLMARSLEATIGRYRAVSAVYAQKKLPCSQLRQTYGEVEDSWTRYSIARGRAYGGEVPERLLGWDAELYEAVRDVDRDFTASGCNRP